MFKLVNGLFVFVIFTLLALLWQRWEVNNFDYQCGECGQVFSLNAWQRFFAPHIMWQKLVRCPHCGKWTMATPVRKD